MYKNKVDLLFKQFSSLFLTTEICQTLKACPGVCAPQAPFLLDILLPLAAQAFKVRNTIKLI